VGSRVGEGYVLQSVGLRSATLGTRMDAPAAFTLQLPVKAPINVSVPPPISSAPVMQAPPNPGVLPATMPAMAPAAAALQPQPQPDGAAMPQPGQGGATAQ